MRLFTPSTLLAAALLSAAVVVPFLSNSRSTAGPFALEVRLSSSVAGNVQVYYDSGQGYSEKDSTELPVTPGRDLQLYRLGLPQGSFRNLRFDPIDRTGTIVIDSVRIVNRKGTSVREITLGEFRPLKQIDSMEITDHGLKVVTTPEGNDPQLVLKFDPPLRLGAYWFGLAVGRFLDWMEVAACVFAVIVLALAVLRWAPRLRQGLGAGGRWVAARPGTALAAVAAAAVVASAYPVIFLGKSYVSPNFGTILLYDEFPTLPHSKDTVIVDVKGSDVGAMMWEFVPFSVMQHQAFLHDHELPLWDRYNSGGSPLLAQGFSMFGDPLHLIPVFANGAAWAWDVKYLISKWIFALGLGLTVLAATRHLPSAAIVTLAAPFVGFFVYRVNHPAIFSLCYSPWILYCWLRAIQTVRPRAVAGWAAGLVLANFVLINTGTVKEAYAILLTLNFSGACMLIASEAPWRQRLIKLAALAWAGVLFTLFASPVWFTFLDTLRHAYTAYNYPSVFQIRPALLLGAFDEAFYRPLSKSLLVFDPSVNFLILAGLLYFLATLRLQFTRRVVIALAASSLLPLSLAFGLVPGTWIEKIPFIANISHIDNSFTCPLIVLWSVLAGVGFSTAAKRIATREGREDLVIAGLLLFALVFQFIAFRQVVHRDSISKDTTFMPLQMSEAIPVSSFVWGYLAVLLAAVVALGLLARRALARREVSPATALGLALCAFLLLWRQGAQLSAAGFENYVVRPPPRVNFHAHSSAIQLVQDAQKAEPSRVIGLQGNLFPGWTGVYGLEGISSPDALVSPNYRQLVGLSALTRLWDWRLYLSRYNLAASRPILDLLNVRYYFDLRSDQAALGAVLKFDRGGDLDVYESRTAWPRAFFTDRIGIYKTAEQFVQQVENGDGRPFAAVQDFDLPRDPEIAGISHDLKGRAVVPANRYRLTSNTTSFEIQAPGPGIAVLTEVWWSGYPHAEIDGKPVRVVRVNHAFEGVAIESAGLHHVSIHYRPRFFDLTLALSAAALLLMAGSFYAALLLERRSNSA